MKKIQNAINKVKNSHLQIQEIQAMLELFDKIKQIIIDKLKFGTL